MMIVLKKNFIFTVLVCVGFFILITGAHAWTSPSSSPPSGSGIIVVESGSPAGTLYIDSVGNIGVSNASPQSTLDVGGIIRAQQLCDETGANCKDVSTGWGSSLWSQSGVDIYYNAGYVGIGIGTPSTRLHVNEASGSNNIATFENSGNNRTSYFNNWGDLYLDSAAGVFVNNIKTINSTDDLGITTRGTGDLILQVGATGKVGVGVTNPSADFHFVGSPTDAVLLLAPNEAADGDDSTLFLSEDDNGTYGMKLVYDGGQNEMRIYGYSNGSTYGPHIAIARNTGNFGIGTNNPQAKLDLNGTFAISGNQGTLGQVLTSQGAGVAPIWSASSSVSLSGKYQICDSSYTWRSVNMGTHLACFMTGSVGSNSDWQTDCQIIESGGIWTLNARFADGWGGSGCCYARCLN